MLRVGEEDCDDSVVSVSSVCSVDPVESADVVLVVVCLSVDMSDDVCECESVVVVPLVTVDVLCASVVSSDVLTVEVVTVCV